MSTQFSFNSTPQPTPAICSSPPPPHDPPVPPSSLRAAVSNYHPVSQYFPHINAATFDLLPRPTPWEWYGVSPPPLPQWNLRAIIDPVACTITVTMIYVEYSGHSHTYGPHTTNLSELHPPSMIAPVTLTTWTLAEGTYFITA
jgi:hypothetical protein